MWKFLFPAALLLACIPQTPVIAQPQAADAGPPADLTISAIRGETAVWSRCSACHAVGLHDVSPNPAAPPLRVIGSRYPVENLQEAFAEGIMVSHDQAMPAFTLSPDEAADIIAYLKELHREDPSAEMAW